MAGLHTTNWSKKGGAMNVVKSIIISFLAASILIACGGGAGSAPGGSGGSSTCTGKSTGTGTPLIGCGGGAGSAPSGTCTGTSTGTGTGTPSITFTPGTISRMVVNGTSAAIDVVIQPNNFTFSGTLYATAVDPTGVFMPAVSVAPPICGSYTLTLTTSTAAAAGQHTGNVTLKLCSDAACTTPQQVPSITVPFSISELAPTSAWLGNNLTALAAWPGAPDWTMFQGNAAHTGYVPVDVDPNKVTTRWQTAAVTSLNNLDYPLGSTLTTANSQFFVSGSNILYARNELDGSTAWQYSFAGLTNPSVNPPAVANGAVYVAAGQQSSTFMFAFNAANGTLIFKSPMTSQWENYLAPTIGANGIYTNAGTFGGLYAFNATGTQLFFDNTLAQTSMWTPAVDGTGVYSYTGGVLKVDDPVSGAALHSITDPTFTNYVYQIGGAPVLGAPGSVFVANYANSVLNGGAIGNTLTKFNVTTNSIGWQVAGNYPSTPAYAAGVLYVANQNPLRLEARAETTGALLWSWIPPQAGDSGFASEVLLTNKLIFISTNLATYAIDVASHKTVWSYPQMGRLALSKNGIFYIQGATQLTAINLK